MHGRVDGQIPDVKWEQFVKTEKRRTSVQPRDSSAEVAARVDLASSALPHEDAQ